MTPCKFPGIVFALLILPAAARPMFGALITQADTGSFITSVGYGAICPGNVTNGSDTAAANCHVQLGVTQFHADAEARAGYGSLGVLARASMNTAGQVATQIQFWSDASATFVDTLTFTSPGQTSGFIQWLVRRICG